MRDASDKIEPGGFAMLPKGLLRVWPYLPAHHLRIVPLIESFQPNSWPSQGLLAALLRVSRQSINRTVQQLRDAGMYVVDHRSRPAGGNTSCLYRRADLDDDGTRGRVVAWYCRSFPDTPAARALSTVGVDSAPLSTPTVDSPCKPQDATAAVNRKTRQRLSTPTVDTNEQQNSQANPQPLRGADSPAVEVAGCAVVGGEQAKALPADEWFAFAMSRGDRLSEQSKDALRRQLSRLTIEQASGAVQTAIAGNFKTVYTDRIKTNGSAERKAREWPEPDYANLIHVVGRDD